MDALEVLRTRRSIRKYSGEPVTDAEIKTILECAMLAPSANNQQPWHFVVIRDEKLREQIAKASPYAHMATSAAVVFVVLGDKSLNKAPGFWVQDCSAAMENMLLAARSLNIGTVWCGLYPENERVEVVAKIIGSPEHMVPLGLICAGHTTQKFQEAQRFNPERIHYDHW